MEMQRRFLCNVCRFLLYLLSINVGLTTYLAMNSFKLYDWKVCVKGCTDLLATSKSLGIRVRPKPKLTWSVIKFLRI